MWDFCQCLSVVLICHIVSSEDNEASFPRIALKSKHIVVSGILIKHSETWSLSVDALWY